MNFALKMMNFALKMMDFALKMMSFALTMMNFSLKMMSFSLKIKNLGKVRMRTGSRVSDEAIAPPANEQNSSFRIQSSSF